MNDDAPRHLASDAAAAELSIVPVSRLELAFEPKPWRFADERRAEIDALFASLQQARSGVWNGRVLVLHRHCFIGDVFSGAYLETDYASFIAWRALGFPESGVRNCFACGALRSRDGAFLLGVMGAHTANAGMTYFPAGTPDPSDVVDGMVDLEANVRREAREETGLSEADFIAAPGWQTVLAGPRIAHMKLIDVDETADRLQARIRAFIASECTPELADIHIVRGPADLTAQMPAWIVAFIRSQWGV